MKRRRKKTERKKRIFEMKQKLRGPTDQRARGLLSITTTNEENEKKKKKRHKAAQPAREWNNKRATRRRRRKAFYKARKENPGEDERRNNNNLRCRMKIIHFIRRKKLREEEIVMSIHMSDFFWRIIFSPPFRQMIRLAEPVRSIPNRLLLLISYLLSGSLSSSVFKRISRDSRRWLARGRGMCFYHFRLFNASRRNLETGKEPEH